MRGLLLGAAVAGAAALAIFLTPGGVRADEPVSPNGDALAELVFAGAPLVSDATSDSSAGSSSSVGPPPNGPAAAPAAASVPPPNVDQQVNPALPDIPVPNPVDILGLDPKDWAGDILNAILTMIGKALIEAFRGFTDWALGVSDSSLNFVTRTPAAGTYESPTVLSLWDFSRALVNVSLAAIVMWGGFNIMVKEHTRSPYHEAMELLPRVILAALAANLTLEFAKFLIDLNNALAASVGDVGLPGYDQATPEQEGIALIFTALAYGIVAILLVFQMLMRLALIDMLIVLSPVAALLWVLPQTQGWFRWWADLFPITVFQQAIQVMVLSLGTALMVELTPGSLSNALLTLMLGIAVCWLTLKVPSRMLDARSGKIASAEREVAYEDVDRLRDALQRGEERVFSSSLYLCLRAPNPAALDELTRRVEAALSGMLASSRPALYEMLPGLLSCLPAGQDHLGRCRNLDTTSAATMIPFTSSHLSMERGILYGINVHNNSLVIFDPFSRDLENANKVVFAKSGAGKSYACKVEALRALMLGVEYYVIDPEDEYRRVCEAVGGQYIRLSGTSPHHINPFDLPPASRDDGEASDPLAERLLSLQGLLGLMLSDRGSTLDQREKGALDAALLETYRRGGISRDPRTHSRPAPVLRDLHTVLREQGDPYNLTDRLERYVDGSLGQVFSSQTSVDLDRPFVVFNVRDLDPDLRPIAIHLIADYIWSQVRRDRRPRMLLIDEAWALMQHEEGARFLSSMARRARKYYLGLTTVTQDVEDFLATPEGHTVLANSSVQILMRQDSSTIDVVSQTFRLSSGEREFLLACQKGEALFFARGNHIALRVEASPMEHALATTDPAELAEFVGVMREA